MQPVNDLTILVLGSCPIYMVWTIIKGKIQAQEWKHPRQKNSLRLYYWIGGRLLNKDQYQYQDFID